MSRDICGSNNRIIKDIPVKGCPLQLKSVAIAADRIIAADPSTHKIYVAENGTNSIAVIDGSNNSIIKDIPVKGCPLRFPRDIAVGHGKIYVANRGDNTVSVIDGKTNHVTATITVGKNPSAVSVNPSTDVAYVANRGDNTVSVIECKTNNVIDIK